MEYPKKVLQLIYDAIDQVNGMSVSKKAIEKSPGTVLIGPGSVMDSLTFVNLAAVLEEEIERCFKEKVSLIDLFFADKKREWTVTDMAVSISCKVNHAAPGQRVEEGNQ